MMATESTQAHEAATEVAPVWRPSPEYISGSHLERLIRALGIDLDLRNPEAAYDALYRRSITSPDEFWSKTFELLGVEFDVYWLSPDEMEHRLTEVGFATVFWAGRPAEGEEGSPQGYLLARRS